MGELGTALIRQTLLIFFTALVVFKFESRTKAWIGIALILISRTVLLPLHLFQETGVPMFSTELVSAQVKNFPRMWQADS